MWYDSLAILLNEQKEACQLSQVTFCCPCERACPVDGVVALMRLEFGPNIHTVKGERGRETWRMSDTVRTRWGRGCENLVALMELGGIRGSELETVVSEV